MPKPKLASQAEPPNNGNNLELDPLIDALLEHLPAPGDHWPKENRTLWLQILDLSFKLIYSEHPLEGTGEPNEPGYEATPR
jgi:hypothetical protein